MDVGHNIRSGQDQHIVVAPQIMPVRSEALPAKVRFSEPAALDHGTHGAVNDQDTLLQC